MTIHKAGYLLLLKVLLILVALNVLSYYFINNTTVFNTLLIIKRHLLFIDCKFLPLPQPGDHPGRQHNFSSGRRKNRSHRRNRRNRIFQRPQTPGLYFYEHFQCTYQLVSGERNHSLFQIPQRKFCSGLSPEIFLRERKNNHCY